MSTRASALLLILATAVFTPAPAQSEQGYDPDRSCRVYVLQHLPVPVRCMAELLGNWSPKPYIDGDLMFRNRGEWLTWKDREDYRHWKAHDYAWRAGMPPAAAPTVAPVAVAVAGQPAAALLCPRTIVARLVLDRAALQGWSGEETSATLQLAPSPRVEGNVLVCTYGNSSDRISLTRPAWGRCTPRTDGTGFDCSP
jgi:hypothetical protein